MTDAGGVGPRLVLGPLLRYVDETAVTVWIEADRACLVEILGRQARTFEVAGHHYALVVIDGLAPGTETEYQVTLDGAVCWPEPGGPGRPSVLRTLDPGRPLRLVFGSCRIAELPARPRRRWSRARAEPGRTQPASTEPASTSGQHGAGQHGARPWARRGRAGRLGPGPRWAASGILARYPAADRRPGLRRRHRARHPAVHRRPP